MELVVWLVYTCYIPPYNYGSKGPEGVRLAQFYDFVADFSKLIHRLEKLHLLA
jgi:hypothetical protein